MSFAKPPAEKPFPWRCPKCRQLTVTRVTIPYQCQRTHKDRAVTVVIPNLAVPRCSNCGELVFDYTADQQIRAAFRDQFGLPEPVASTTTEQPAIGSNHITANHEPGVVVPGKGKPG